MNSHTHKLTVEFDNTQTQTEVHEATRILLQDSERYALHQNVVTVMYLDKSEDICAATVFCLFFAQVGGLICRNGFLISAHIQLFGLLLGF